MFALLLALFVLALPQAQAPAVVCSNIWQNKTTEFEEYLRAAKVEKVTDLPSA